MKLYFSGFSLKHEKELFTEYRTPFPNDGRLGAKPAPVSLSQAISYFFEYLWIDANGKYVFPPQHLDDEELDRLIKFFPAT